MKQQTELKNVRYGSSFRPSTKSTVLFALATFFLVIHVVKSSSIQEEEFSNDNGNLNSHSDGELNFYRCFTSPSFTNNYFLTNIESESCDHFRRLSRW